MRRREKSACEKEEGGGKLEEMEVGEGNAAENEELENNEEVNCGRGNKGRE